MNAAAPWLLPTNGRITVTVKPGIGAYTRFRTLPAVPWLHVRNQEKQFARKHFAFAREEKRFAREHFAFAREHFTFTREQKRFPRCRRSGVVFPRSVHPPSDPGLAKRDGPPAASLQTEQLFKKLQER